MLLILEFKLTLSITTRQTLKPQQISPSLFIISFQQEWLKHVSQYFEGPSAGLRVLKLRCWTEDFVRWSFNGPNAHQDFASCQGFRGLSTSHDKRDQVKQAAINLQTLLKHWGTRVRHQTLQLTAFERTWLCQKFLGTSKMHCYLSRLDLSYRIPCA